MIMTLSRVFEKAEATTDDAEVDEYRRELIGVHGELAPEGTRRCLEMEIQDQLQQRRAFLPRYYAGDHRGADN
jgi:hypothetical protein